jgi:hypothetical protein
MSNERFEQASFRRRTFFPLGERRADKVCHRRGMNAACSDARRSSEVEDKDNGIPYEYRKEWAAHIPFFHKNKSANSSR